MTRVRNISPAIPFIYIHGHDDATVTVTPTAMDWSHVHFKNSALHFIEGETRITVQKGGEGLYMLYINGGVTKKTGNPTICHFDLYKNGVIVEGASAHCMIGAGDEHSNVGMVVCFEAIVGDYIEIIYFVDAGTGNLEANTSRLILQALPMEGWNNNRGSRKTIYEGLKR